MRPLVFADMKCAPSRPLRLGYLQGPGCLLLLKCMLRCAWSKGRRQEKRAPVDDHVAFKKPPSYFLKRRYANDIRSPDTSAFAIGHR